MIYIHGFWLSILFLLPDKERIPILVDDDLASWDCQRTTLLLLQVVFAEVNSVSSGRAAGPQKIQLSISTHFLNSNITLKHYL